MLSNFDIEEIANHYQIPIVVVMKDELKNIKLINTNYIVNLESSKDGNGTHWMGLKIENKECVYFDSYGMLPFAKEFQNHILHIIQKKFKILKQRRVDFSRLLLSFSCILILLIICTKNHRPFLIYFH